MTGKVRRADRIALVHSGIKARRGNFPPDVVLGSAPEPVLVAELLRDNKLGRVRKWAWTGVRRFRIGPLKRVATNNRVGLIPDKYSFNHVVALPVHRVESPLLCHLTRAVRRQRPPTTPHTDSDFPIFIELEVRLMLGRLATVILGGRLQTGEAVPCIALRSTLEQAAARVIIVKGVQIGDLKWFGSLDLVAHSTTDVADAALPTGPGALLGGKVSDAASHVPSPPPPPWGARQHRICGRCEPAQPMLAATRPLRSCRASGHCGQHGVSAA